MEEKFKQAQEKVNTLTQKPTNEELLELYALYKQATTGDNQNPKPGIFDMKAMFKWKMWKEKEGMSKADAMKAYIELVDNLLEKYPHR